MKVLSTSETGRVAPGSGCILGLLAVAVLSVLGILGYEPRRVDPLLELRLFRSVPFSAAILMALFALCAFGAFLFVTTQYLQDVRGMSALTAGGGACSRSGCGGTGFIGAAHSVWWLVLGLGVGILVLGLLSTERRALDSAGRAAALFEGVDRGADRRTAPLGR